MTEYLFRGKTTQWDWVFGSLDQSDKKETFIRVHHTELPSMPVHNETVGQYIGIKGYTGEYMDRRHNEVKLFEGDIVEAWSTGGKSRFVIKYRNGSHPGYILYPAYQNGKMWSIAGDDAGRSPGDFYDDLCLIGNIHDNPELIIAAP